MADPPRFLVDEDMPRSTGHALKAAGFEAFDVRDVGLRGKSDAEVFSHAQREGLVLLTGDWGFGNLLMFPVGSHHGIVLVHFPNEIPTADLNINITSELRKLSADDFSGSLIILEPGKTRLRRPHKS